MASRALVAVVSQEGAWNKSFVRDPALSLWRMVTGTHSCPSLCLHMVCCSAGPRVLVPHQDLGQSELCRGYLRGGPGSRPSDRHCPTNLFPGELAHSRCLKQK